MYTKALHELSECCAFANKKEVRGTFVIALISKELSEKLQLTPGLTLERMLETARIFDQVRKKLQIDRLQC